MTTPSSPNPKIPRLWDRLIGAIEVTTQVLGSVLTIFGAIIFVVALIILWLNSIISSHNSIPSNVQSEMAGAFLLSGYLIIPGWALMCIGFSLFPFRERLFKTLRNTVQ